MRRLPEFFPEVTSFQWDDGTRPRTRGITRRCQAEAKQSILDPLILVANVWTVRQPWTKIISLRLLPSLVAAWKILATKREVPDQSLPKVFLAERVARERAAAVGGVMPSQPRQRPAPASTRTRR